MSNYPRREVRWFAERMERKLQQNDHKGGWNNDSFHALLRRMREEVDELESAQSDQEKLIDECADVANFAMMIAENALVEQIGKVLSSE